MEVRILKGLERGEFVSADSKGLSDPDRVSERVGAGEANEWQVVSAGKKWSWESWMGCEQEFHFESVPAGETPTPPFFVSVASKGVRFFVNPLDATLVGWLVSVASE